MSSHNTVNTGNIFTFITMKTKSLTIPVSDSIGSVSAEIMEPDNMRFMLVLAHGAGAGMSHRFMITLAKALYEHGIGTARYNFPYMENGKKRPDVPAVAEKTVAVVIEKIHERYTDVPLLAGGKSFGGRMTSQYFSKQSPAYVKGLVFFGFPLHAAGKPSVDRAAHLKNITLPMLFLQGTRDALAKLDLIEEVCSGLPSATLQKLEGADHSFMAGKKDFIAELAQHTNSWILKF
jgi:predicted alpha/beta-hydrolase family hydrolase